MKLVFRCLSMMIGDSGRSYNHACLKRYFLVASAAQVVCLEKVRDSVSAAKAGGSQAGLCV